VPTPRPPPDRASRRRAAPAADPAPASSGRATAIRRPSDAGLGRGTSRTAEAGQPDGNLAEQRGDRVLAVILDPAGRATTAACRTVHGMNPGLRGDNLPLDIGQEPLALGQAQTQGAQIGKRAGPGDPHDIGAVFFAISSDAHQLHDPGHAVSTSTESRPETTPLSLAPPISRQSRGGSRRANAALYRVVIVRMRGHQPTLDYVRRRTAEGKSKPEIIRCLKRFVAREIFGYLCRPADIRNTASAGP
jgi:hypothetical protein